MTLKLKIDSSAVFSDTKFQILNEISKIRHETESVGVQISDHLDLVLRELVQTLEEYSGEIKELITVECKRNSVELVDVPEPAYNFPDDWEDGGLVTCKKCLFKWDGHAQHVCM